MSNAWKPPTEEGVYKSGEKAYCKYCYETHRNWQRRTVDDHYFALGQHPFELVWICRNCDHATKDEFMQVVESD